MARPLWSVLGVAHRRGFVPAGLALGALLIMSAATAKPARSETAPEFPSQDPKQWIGQPQSLKALFGKVVLIDVWTFG